ncbi:MAG: ABC transporter ATP-binding protein [Deltaproteobacteria bacterium]|nr:ABC transporter ATP-binding protein [Deltaproteobacteria bacterium]
MLEISNLFVRRGASQVIRGVSCNFKQGEIAALLGSNGAGKTTLIESIMGLHPKDKGTIALRNQDVTHCSASQIARLGIACAPEGRRLFPDMTVLENLEMGAYLRRARPRVKENIEQVYSLFPALKSRADQVALSLSGGEQQMTAIGRALMSNPILLFIDELSLGLSPKICQDLFRTIRKIAEGGVSIVIVEQNAILALKHSQRAYVLESGKIVLEGPSEQLRNNEHVRQAYLGI